MTIKKVDKEIMLLLHEQIKEINKKIAYLRDTKKQLIRNLWITRATYYNFLRDEGIKIENVNE